MNTKRPALGRGLSALLPGREESAPSGAVREIEIARLHPNRFQPRAAFDEASLKELADSIRASGIVQPIVVVPRGDGDYTILAGERRFRAASLAGLAKVPVTVRGNATDAEMLELALVENLQRQDLNPMEEAAAYGRLREEFHLTQEQIAEKVGKERATVANTLRLLRLPAPVRELIRGGQLSAGHAKAIAAVPTPDAQVALSEEIVRRGLSVRQAEGRAASLAQPEGKVRKERRRDPFTRDAEERLSRRLKTKVRIARRRRGGTIGIEFGSEEELMRLFDQLTGKH